MRKVIHWELCKKLKFDHTNKWYIQKSEYVLENETHKTFLYFEIQIDHQHHAGRSDLMIVNKTKQNKKEEKGVPAELGT